MSNYITVPILEDKFNTNCQIGTLTILKDRLPTDPNFVFTIGYRIEENSPYELKAVALLSDEEFLSYLKNKDAVC